jgi:hypothetical protein
MNLKRGVINIPADVSLRASHFLVELFKDDDSPFLTLTKKDLYSRICFVLEFSSPSSAWGMIYFLKGGKLVKEKFISGQTFYYFEKKICEEFIKKHEGIDTKDKKIKRGE